MTIRTTAGFGAVALLVGTLACAGGMAREEDQAGAPQDTTEAQNPPGYRGMEQDTTQTPTDSQPTATDTFLQEQGTGVPEDTAGYSGLEQPDTTGAATQDTTTGVTDTTAMPGMDTTTPGMDTTAMPGADTSGMSGMGDTTGQTGWDSTAQQ
jgi:hypothetical protein